MEKISLHNYEAWFLDYMEGNLSLEERNDLYEFLELHPDLKAELEEDFDEVILIPVADNISDKSALVVEEGGILISQGNVDDLMIASIEGDLNPSQNEKLTEFVKENKLEKSFTAYSNTILQADMTEVLDEKDKLKKKPLIIPLYVRVASIAAVGILLIGIALNNTGTNEADGVISNNGVYVADGMQPKVNSDHLNTHSTGGFSGIQINNIPDLPDTYEMDVYNSPLPDLMVDDVDSQDSVGIPEIILPPEDENNIVLNTDTIPAKIDFNEDLNISEVRTVEEQPIKIVTDAAGNLFNRDISFKREKNLESEEYVAYSVNIGKFQFERKKSK